jgi:hypothetical protein
VQDGRFTAGGGATEIEMARQIAAWGETHPGLEQYSISRSPFVVFNGPDPGSGAFLTLDPKPIFLISYDKFFGKKYGTGTKIQSVWLKKFLYLFKNKIVQFYDICGYKKW